MIDRNKNSQGKIQAGNDADHLFRIATALTKVDSLADMAARVAVECKAALQADAICVYLVGPKGSFDMVAEIGCTDEFKREYARIEKDQFPLLNVDSPGETLFIGTPSEFKFAIPKLKHDVIDRSKRETIAYAPLFVNNSPIGVLGFSYNQKREDNPEKKTFVLTLVNFCAQALERVKLIEQEGLAREEAELANRAKSQFLANISHEIRTPLGVIQGYADLLFESLDISPPHRQWASVIRRNTRQLVAIIGEVLDLSKIEAEKIDIEKIRFSLWEVLEDIRAVASFKTRDSNVEFSFFSDNMSEFIYTDPTRLRQILLNLITNSIKFTASGFVKVEACMSEEGMLAVTIEDSGLGIPMEHQSKIFQPFAQADSSTSRRFGGTGLGLSISKRLAQALGGDVILVESTPNVGSKFKFIMKCEPVPPEEQSDCMGQSVTGSRNQLAGMNVLLVEDSADNQELISYLLVREGANVDVAESGKKAIELALKNDYAVILMDIQMPEIDGHEALSRLRKLGVSKPIAALTAHALRDEREKSLNEGFDDYLTKPIDVPMLIQSVKRLGRLAR